MLGTDERPRSSRRPRSIRCAARQSTVTRSRTRSNVFSPRIPRERSSSTATNRASSRAAMIFSAVTGPIPGSVSSCSAVAVLRSTRAAPPPAGASLATGATVRRRVVPGRHADLVPVGQHRREAELDRDPGRIDARPVPAGRGDEVRHPRTGRQSEHARPDHGSDDLDDDLASGRSGRHGRDAVGRPGRPARVDTDPVAGSAGHRQTERDRGEDDRDGDDRHRPEHAGRRQLRQTLSAWRSLASAEPPRRPVSRRALATPGSRSDPWIAASSGGRSPVLERRDVSPPRGHFRRGETSIRTLTTGA